MEAVRPDWSEGEKSLPNIEQDNEVVPERVASDTQNLSFAERELAAKALEKQPTIAADIVAKAAEKGRPIEKELEVRHEKRGSLDDQPAMSVGEIIENTPTLSIKQANQEKVSKETDLKVSSTPRVSRDNSGKQLVTQPALYRQAIITGFVIAMLLIFGFLTLVILL